MKLISTIKEVQNYISVNNSFAISRLLPHIDRVMRRNFLPLFGKDLLKEFVDAYQTAHGALSEKTPQEQKEILDSGLQYTLAPEQYHEPLVLLQDALTNIAFMNCLSQMQTTMGEAGIRLAVNDNQKTAFQWQVDDMKYQLASDGYNALDSLLNFLEDHEAEFPNWKTSDSYYQQKDFFVETAEQFNAGYYISNSRMTFLTLRYIMKRIEQFDVQRIITPLIYQRLKEKQQTAFTPKEEILLGNFLRPGIVLLTVAKGIVERAIEVSDLGVQANLYTYYVTLKDARKKYQNESDRDLMIQQLTNDGNEFLQKGREYLDANADEFGEIEDLDSETNFRVINHEGRKIYGM